LHANLFRGICNKSTNQQVKSTRKQLISFAQVIKFLQHIKLKGGSLNPPPLVYTLDSETADTAKPRVVLYCVKRIISKSVAVLPLV